MAVVLVAGTQPTLVQTEPNKQTKIALGYGIPPFKVIFSAFSTHRTNMLRDDALEMTLCTFFTKVCSIAVTSEEETTIEKMSFFRVKLQGEYVRVFF